MVHHISSLALFSRLQLPLKQTEVQVIFMCCINLRERLVFWPPYSWNPGYVLGAQSVVYNCKLSCCWLVSDESISQWSDVSWLLYSRPTWPGQSTSSTEAGDSEKTAASSSRPQWRPMPRFSFWSPNKSHNIRLDCLFGLCILWEAHTNFNRCCKCVQCQNITLVDWHCCE